MKNNKKEHVENKLEQSLKSQTSQENRSKIKFPADFTNKNKQLDIIKPVEIKEMKATNQVQSIKRPNNSRKGLAISLALGALAVLIVTISTPTIIVLQNKAIAAAAIDWSQSDDEVRNQVQGYIDSSHAATEAEVLELVNITYNENLKNMMANIDAIVSVSFEIESAENSTYTLIPKVELSDNVDNTIRISNIEGLLLVPPVNWSISLEEVKIKIQGYIDSSGDETNEENDSTTPISTVTELLDLVNNVYNEELKKLTNNYEVIETLAFTVKLGESNTYTLVADLKIKEEYSVQAAIGDVQGLTLPNSFPIALNDMESARMLIQDYINANDISSFDTLLSVVNGELKEQLKSYLSNADQIETLTFEARTIEEENDASFAFKPIITLKDGNINSWITEEILPINLKTTFTLSIASDAVVTQYIKNTFKNPKNIGELNAKFDEIQSENVINAIVTSDNRDRINDFVVTITQGTSPGRYNFKFDFEAKGGFIITNPTTKVYSNILLPWTVVIQLYGDVNNHDPENRIRRLYNNYPGSAAAIEAEAVRIGYAAFKNAAISQNREYVNITNITVSHVVGRAYSFRFEYELINDTDDYILQVPPSFDNYITVDF